MFLASKRKRQLRASGLPADKTRQHSAEQQRARAGFWYGRRRDGQPGGGWSAVVEGPLVDETGIIPLQDDGNGGMSKGNRWSRREY
jgi:hypothetical protein